VPHESMQETLCLGLGHLQGKMSKLSKEADCTLEHFMTSEFNSFSIGRRASQNVLANGKVVENG
jgi:hypothetical protein